MPLRNLPTFPTAPERPLLEVVRTRNQHPVTSLPSRTGLEPFVALQLVRSQQLVRLVLGLCWIYQGVVPKLLFPDTGELRMVQSLGFSLATAYRVAEAVGVAEILFGLLFWVLPRGGLRVAYWVNILGLAGLALGVLFSQPALFVAPFNPFTLNLSMMTLAAVGLLTLADAPTATQSPQPLS
jgi:hypothetical protein